MLDHDLNGVRGHVLKQVFAIDKEREAGKKGADKAETILEMACRIIVQSKDSSVQSQMGDALKAWLEVPTGDLLVTPTGAEVSIRNHFKMCKLTEILSTGGRKASSSKR